MNGFRMSRRISAPLSRGREGKRIALWITVPVEFFPLDAPAQPFPPARRIDVGYPDLWNYSSRDYGARIGIYRIMRVSGRLRYRARPPRSIRARAAYPRLIDEMLQRNWEFIANGVDMGHVHHGGLTVESERELIQRPGRA